MNCSKLFGILISLYGFAFVTARSLPDSSLVNKIEGIPSGQIGTYARGLKAAQLGSIAANFPFADFGVLFASLSSDQITSLVSAIPDGQLPAAIRKLPSSVYRPIVNGLASDLKEAVFGSKAKDTENLTSKQLKDTIASAPSPVITRLIKQDSASHLGVVFDGLPKSALGGVAANFPKDRLGKTIKADRNDLTKSQLEGIIDGVQNDGGVNGNSN